MNPAQLFRDDADLNMNRYQMPGYTGYFPGKKTFTGISKGRATQAALARGGYYGHDGAHSLLEPNQDDQHIVHLQNVDAVNRKEHFDLKEHLQGGQPVYRDQMIPGYTGHNPCIVDKIGRTFPQRCLDGTLEFERIRAGIPRYRLPLYDKKSSEMQLIGGRDHKYTAVVDRDVVPIDLTTPEFTPRYLGHNHANIVRRFGLGLVEKTFSQFDKAKAYQQQMPVHLDHHDWPPLPPKNGPVTPFTSNGVLQYEPVILPPSKHPHLIPQLVEIKQPKTMNIIVPRPSWYPTMKYRTDDFKWQHAMSGFAGFVPEARDVLGESVHNAIVHGYSPYIGRS